jgi:glycosyltransferase involved in cell wall biosynthesis
MVLTAIIPTHNRPMVLRRCLETLQQQEVDPGRFEVIVIDDGSPVDIGEVVAEVSERGPLELRCERLELTGLNGGRNRGAALASGEVLAFLDDDTLVSRGWAPALLRAFEQHPCAAVGGKIELALEGPEPEWLPRRRYYLAEYDLGPEPFWLDDELVDGRDSSPVGANCAIRRSEFERLGGFRSGLDRIADSLVSNGDTEFFRRLRAEGGRMRYEPDAGVRHCVPANRLTVDYFVKRHYAQGVSDELLLALRGEPVSWRRRRILLGKLAESSERLAKDVMRGRGTVEGRFQFSYWAGRWRALGKAPSAPAG